MSAHVTIKPQSTLVLVHDVVNDFVDVNDPGYDPGLKLVLDNIHVLLAAARRAGLAVAFIAPGQGDPSIGPAPRGDSGRLLWGTAGVDIPVQFGPLPGETVVRKPRWGGFFGSNLISHFRELGCDTMIICGLSLSGGIETTVRDAFNFDLQSVVVYDACLTRAVSDQGWGPVSREDVLRVTLSVLAQRFARVATTRVICDELSELPPTGGREESWDPAGLAADSRRE